MSIKTYLSGHYVSPSPLHFSTGQSSTQGVILLAVNVILLQLIHWIVLCYRRFLRMPAESLVGKYKGAGDYDQGNTAIRYIMIWGFGDRR